MASSSSSCDVTKIKHDVFISFRGTDVRKGLLSHLKKELRRRQIDTYVDERLDRGDEIQSSLLKAIEASQILLVIFSKDYASSQWCLDELAKIIECKERNNQIVLPVFFNVDPSHVRHQQGDYGDALTKHEEKLMENMFKVHSWRSALKTAADLSGFHYPTNFENESDLVDNIAKFISEKSSKFSPSESNGLFGIDQNVAQIKSLLLLESSEVLFVGIWGMGGIGKTTIAHTIFDIYSPQYDGCCFLNVREELEQQELNLIREKLISELFEEGLHTSGSSKARFFKSAGRRMGRKKVLVVLDDVNTSEELKYLVDKPNWFGAGSRVIITSRDKHVLTSGGVHHDQIHNVKEMDPTDSLKLFCLNAFNESHPKMGYEKLSEEVVRIALGNPLALKVLGSDFHSRSIDTWECALRRIKQYPNEKIQSVLRFSYDGLHEREKEAFLDIAFFFQDEDEDYVVRQLNARGFYGASGIEVLQQKALITISSDNRIRMHDLIRQMGWEIVRQEFIKYPGRRSRLRDSEDVYDVLRYKQGTNEVEAMQIDVSRITGLPLEVDTFEKMPRLRFLKFHLPLYHDLSMPMSFPEKLDALLVTAGCKELMRVAGEIHIKCVHYLLIDGFLDPSLLTANEISKLQSIARRGVEIMCYSSIGYLNNLEFSDVDYQQFRNLPSHLLCLRSTYYLKLSNSTREDKEKPKLHILFDGLRYYHRISILQFNNSVVLNAALLKLAYFQFGFHLYFTTYRIPLFSFPLKHLTKPFIFLILISLPDIWELHAVQLYTAVILYIILTIFVYLLSLYFRGLVFRLYSILSVFLPFTSFYINLFKIAIFSTFLHCILLNLMPHSNSHSELSPKPRIDFAISDSHSHQFQSVFAFLDGLLFYIVNKSFLYLVNFFLLYMLILISLPKN